MKKFILLFLANLIIFFYGCASKKVVQPEQIETPPQPVTKIESIPKVSPPSELEEKIIEQPYAKVETTEEIPKYKEEELLKDIYFDYDQYDIRLDAKPILEGIAAWLSKNPKIKLLIEGHCDERGTNEYNIALGDRRAKSARDFLVALGISPDRIEMISYGEEKPVCTEHLEECWSKNRRAHFVILKEK